MPAGETAVTETGLSNESGSRPAPKSPSHEDLEHQLDLIVASRVGEDQVTWTIFSIFWAAQVLLIGVLFQGPSFPPTPVAELIVCLFGVGMSTAWGLTQNRSLLHLERFEDVTARIEGKLQIGGHLHPEHRLTMDKRFRGPRARTVMRVCCWGTALAWLISSIIFGCRM